MSNRHQSPSSEYYRRNLPHYLPKDKVYFVTSVLDEAMPQNKIKLLKAQKEQKQNNIKETIKLDTQAKAKQEQYTKELEKLQGQLKDVTTKVLATEQSMQQFAFKHQDQIKKAIDKVTNDPNTTILGLPAGQVIYAGALDITKDVVKHLNGTIA